MSNELTIRAGIKNSLVLVIGLGMAVIIAWATAMGGLVIPVLLAVIAFIIPFGIAILKNPRLGIISVTI